MPHQGERAIPDQVYGRLVTCNQQQDAGGDQLLLVESPFTRLGVELL